MRFSAILFALSVFAQSLVSSAPAAQPDVTACLNGLPNKIPPLTDLDNRIAVYEMDMGHAPPSGFASRLLKNSAKLTVYSPTTDVYGLVFLDNAVNLAKNRPTASQFIQHDDYGKLVISQCSQDALFTHLTLTAQSPEIIQRLNDDAADPTTPILNVVPVGSADAVKKATPATRPTPASSSLTVWGNSGSPWNAVYLSVVCCAAMPDDAWIRLKASGELVPTICMIVGQSCAAEGIPPTNGYLQDLRGKDDATLRIAARVAIASNALGVPAFEQWWAANGAKSGSTHDEAKVIWDAGQAAK